MLVNCLKFREVFSRLADIDRDYKHAPSSKDRDNVAAVVDCLQVFYDATMRFSGTKYPTLNSFTEYCEIYLGIQSWLGSDQSFIVNMATRMIEKFKKYWCNSNVVLAIASILDPRYKLKSVEFYFREIYNSPSDADLNVKNVVTYLNKLFSEYLIKDSRSRNGLQGSNSSSAQNVNISTCESSQRLRSSRQKHFAMYIQNSLGNEPAKSELDTYLEEPNVPGLEDDSFDILTWWRYNALKYPVLSSLVRDILGTPVSTVASESAFSTAGRVLDDYRSSLAPATIEALICTQDWLKASATGTSSNEAAEAFSSVPESILVDGEVELIGLTCGTV